MATDNNDNDGNCKLPASASAMGCGGCQHSVAVRGLTDIVCLAYLTVRQSISSDQCVEFEAKRDRIRNRGEPSPSA